MEVARADLFSVQRMCLRLMGHDFASPDAKGVQRWQKWRTLCHITSVLVVVSAQWPMVDYIVYNRDDLALATACLSICFTNVLTVIKMTTFLLYKRQFMNLMLQLDLMYTQLRGADAKHGLLKANSAALRFAWIYRFTVCLTGLYFMIGPLVKLLWAAIAQKSVTRDLPMPMRFPFDFESSPGYEFAFIYTAGVTLTVVMYASAIDGLFLSFALNLRGHFQALQFFIRTSGFEGKSQERLQYEISGFIQYHSLLLDLSQRIRLIYRPIIFGQFLMTSLQVCVIVYQLVTHMGAIMVMVVYCTFLSSIMLQLFIYCYGGEILRNESLMVGIALQLSDWYQLEPPYRRMLCLIMQRSQREVIIKAGFYEASLANFMTILKAALSYITLIQSIE